MTFDGDEVRRLGRYVVWIVDEISTRRHADSSLLGFLLSDVAYWADVGGFRDRIGLIVWLIITILGHLILHQVGNR